MSCKNKSFKFYALKSNSLVNILVGLLSDSCLWQSNAFLVENLGNMRLYEGEN